MKRLAVILAEGFEEIEAIGIIDVLRRADFEVTSVSISGNTEVTGSHQIKVLADKLFEDVNFDTYDMIILPGGMPGSRNLNEHSGLREEMLSFHEQNKWLGAICAAPLVFGNLGILKNRKATCYPGYENQLHGAVVTQEETEVSGRIVTGKGAGVAIQFALKIVEQFKGEQIAAELARKMMVS